MIEFYELYEGTLELGAAGTALAVSSQVRNVTVEPSENVTTRAAIPVLSGEEIPESSAETFSFVVKGTFIQDLTAGGVVDWSWQNAGTPQAFRLVPTTAGAREVVGVLKPVPLIIGGDVARPGEADPPGADFTWRCVGTPTFGAVAP